MSPEGEGMPKKRRKKTAGQAIIEFVIVLPILLLILASVSQLSLMILRWHQLLNATREGARIASETPLPLDQAGNRALVANAALARTRVVLDNSGIDWWTVNVQTTWETPQAANPGAPVVTDPVTSVETQEGTQYTFLRVQAALDMPVMFGALLRPLLQGNPNFEAGGTDTFRLIGASTAYAEDRGVTCSPSC